MLADSRGPITSALTAALAEHGHAVPADVAERTIGPPLRVALHELLGIDPDSPRATVLVDAYRERYRETLPETRGFDGMEDVLAALAEAGLRLGVATSKPLPFAEPLLDALGLRDRFAAVEGPRLDGTEHKTETVARALASLPDAIALVGDRIHDIRAARAHGLLAVGVTWGIGTRAELAGADALADAPGELVPLLLDAAAQASGSRGA